MWKIKTVLNILKNEGVTRLVEVILGRMIPPKIENFSIIKKTLKNKSGLEIGGPSWIFKNYNLIPIYKIIQNLDGCNFSSTTIWEGELKAGKTFNYLKNKFGIQYIAEATDLFFSPDCKYDFVISSHCLEHIANPLKAIEEWIRVVKSDGFILIVVPNKDKIFDHKRKISSFTHLIDDYKNNIGEEDITHLNEILELHDLSLDLKAGSFEQFKERSLNNKKVRALHHHVFDISLLIEIFNYFNLSIIFSEKVDGNNIIFGEKI